MGFGWMEGGGRGEEGGRWFEEGGCWFEEDVICAADGSQPLRPM